MDARKNPGLKETTENNDTRTRVKRTSSAEERVKKIEERVKKADMYPENGDAKKLKRRSRSFRFYNPSEITAQGEENKNSPTMRNT